MSFIVIRAAIVSFAISFLLSPLNPVQGQTFSVIHQFTGGNDGANSFSSLTLDRAGNLYGTASSGGFTGNNCGPSGCGIVFRLTPHNGAWALTPLYIFQGYSDGFGPLAGVTIGPNDTFYGTTELGGTRGAGTVYNLRPPASAAANVLGGWSETVLHSFTAGADGAYPLYGNLVFDQAGNIYGTTFGGALQCSSDGQGCGSVFELTPQGQIISDFDFPGNGGGSSPESGVILDSAGSLYGTTGDRYFAPVVYELSPNGNGWTQTILYTFPPTADPRGGVSFDGASGFYGTTFGNEEVYQLTPAPGQWNFNLLYTFSGSEGPWSGVVQDASGNLYGTTCGDGAYGKGSVFKLAPTQSGWAETDLYDFTGGSDGSCPTGAPAMDASGNLYGTTLYGGTGSCFGTGCGVVWEITP